jgi:glycosyltransferase involved in cell wall biosynthesis
MHIAFIAPFGMQPKATTSARMLPLAQALARRGHHVRIVIPPWDDPSAPHRLQRRYLPSPTREGSVETVTLPVTQRAHSGLTLTAGLLKWALRSKGEPQSIQNPDVVHVFKPIGYSGMAAFALQALGVPWVLDMDDWEGPGGWVGVNPYSPAQKALITLTEAMLPRMAGAVTVASRTLEARAWDFGLPRRCVLYMPNGVWEDKYRSWTVGAGYGPPSRQDGPTILLYTRFAEFPYQWSLDILKLVLQEHPTAKLLVVGEGFFGEGEKLQADAVRMGLGDRVTFTGRVAEENLPAYLSMGDVAIYPVEDNLITRAKSPVKVLEPMLMGLPIVAHRVGQAAEFIGEAGVLVEPGNLHEMAGAVSSLLSDPERRKRMGEKARQRVWTRFNWERLCSQAEAAYKLALLS